MADARLRLSVAEARALGERALRGIGYDPEEARIVADHVIDAALCGYEYSGLAVDALDCSASQDITAATGASMAITSILHRRSRARQGGRRRRGGRGASQGLKSLGGSIPADAGLGDQQGGASSSTHGPSRDQRLRTSSAGSTLRW